MRTIGLVLSGMLLAGCGLTPVNPEGKACDAEHPCPGALFCIAGVCSASPPETPETPGCDDPRIGQVCSAGKGQCRSEGTWSWGSPSAELCDGVDNDCNGIVDDVAGCVSTAAWSSSPGYAEGSLAEARFHGPYRLLPLPDGDLLISETANSVIRRVSLSRGLVTLEAGTPGECGSVDGGPQVGRLCRPGGMAVDSDGTVYIADVYSHQIRTLKGGVLGTLAGKVSSSGPLDGATNVATFHYPVDVAVIDDRIYVADKWSCRLRMISKTTNTVVTVAGTECSDAGNPLKKPNGLTVAPNKTLYITVSEAAHGVLSFRESVLGSLAGGTYGFADDKGGAARFAVPAGLSATAEGLYVADRDNNRLRFVNYAGEVNTVAGVDAPGFSDGLASGQALLAAPTGVAVISGHVYFVGELDHRLRRLDLETKVVSVVTGGVAKLQGGQGPMAEIARPAGITTDPATGVAFFSDEYNHVIRALHPDGRVVTIAGTGVPGFKNGLGLQAQFRSPLGLRFSPEGNGKLIVADTGNHRIREIDLESGEVRTIAGTGTCGSARGEALFEAQLCAPTDVALGPDGALFISDGGSSTLRILKKGQLNIFAGEAWKDGHRDGQRTLSWFNNPRALEVGPDGRLYVADAENDALRIVDLATGEVSTPIGLGDCSDRTGTVGDPVSPPRFCRPSGLMFDGSDLYIASTGSNRIHRLSEGSTSSVAGVTWQPGLQNGFAFEARFDEPWALAPAPGGGFYVTDPNGGGIRRVMP